MKKVLVFGAGLIGAPIAFDLAADDEFDVTVVDVSKINLTKFDGCRKIKTWQRDLSDTNEVARIVKGFDFVLSAVPGYMGFNTLKAVIEAGKDVVDISFFSEDPFDLNQLAIEKGVVAIADMGVAPGMSNVLVGHACSELEEPTNVKIYVGGLPRIREWPYEYKAVFSPVDVIEEYTRPARFVENGNCIIKPALSDPELLDFPCIGTLEAFNSDGLRSLIKTIKCSNMIEKTLRYKGHIEIIKVLRDTGFFDKKPIELNGTKISPLEFTSKILFPKWKLNEGDEDLTVMRIIVEGVQKNKSIRYTYDLLDYYNTQTCVHSMARTTGYAATMALRTISNGLYESIGISTPEFLGKDKNCVDFMLNGLAQRGIYYTETIEEF
ncbi:MAG: saccharopine dehydrogenase C-terminal domain-containing protein [Bacteroidales bacterium]|jgi:lysine 6-dehydrogenase|nr:saccharopine dehydrogenase NADP-binding domain-containing protein [Bacteroidales bacterium]MDI9592326.1 saccharopine dehydrogenase C-terminal domain-containing protein [Bacteroidota bacterium]HOF80951.1 saccharopine dehydrogenase C-terminal domain-containing protein [Bacteroidales bacterium]HOR76271.1 saccharopine dehydrogenase C-terminal domain-containing protein [Bacteroidales bacterium]HPA13071.1 saccharopine dehydrogenase C-terminal domain-containing protein [Bacteroidales bacterium]